MSGNEIFDGYFAHWDKNTNLAAAFDAWFLNLLPRSQPFLFNEHGYQTLNFIPSIATMIFGVMTGAYLRSDRPKAVLRNGLLKAGALGVLGGLLAGWLLCPIVKSIWTPSWALFSAGCVLVLLALCYQLIEVSGHRGWALPFVAAGRNPILLYVIALKYSWWVLEAWRRTFGIQTFAGYWGPILEALACGFTLWVVAWALYRFRIFIRL
jgi:predicted acyltransferase